MIQFFADASKRAWVYTVAAAIIAALVVYGVVATDEAPLWAALVAAVLWALGNLTAVMHTDSVGRAALYGVALAVLAILLYRRVIDEAQMTAWTGLAAAIFGVGTNALARVNVTPSEVDDDDYEESLADPAIEDLDDEGMAH